MESNTSFINASLIPPSGRAGRWMPSSSSDGLIAHWCSSSLEFCFSGTKLSMLVGGETERKDRLNGGTKMIAVITGANRDETLVDLNAWRTFDPEPSSEVVIFDREDGVRHEKTFVRVVLIDWASKIEVKGFILDANGSINPVAVQDVDDNHHISPPLLLVVGDSISSGLAVDVDKGGEPLPFGCLNTFPFVAQSVLRGSVGKEIDVELIGYPGFSLVHPTEKEKEEGYPHGMQTAFFWESPWSSAPWTESSSPKAVLIELGTNDQFFKIPPERFGKALIAFVDALLKWSQNSIANFWLVPPFPDADVPDARELVDAMPRYIGILSERFGNGVSFKLCNLVEGLTVDDTVDGVHPRLRVHNEVGNKLADFIEKNWYQ